MRDKRSEFPSFFNFHNRTEGERQKPGRFLMRQQNLGIVPKGQGGESVKRYRSEKLWTLKKYYDGSQYDHKKDWFASEKSESMVPLRDRKPYVTFAFAKTLSKRVAAKLVGHNQFVKMTMDDPMDNEFLKVLLKTSRLRSRLKDPLTMMLAQGASFLRFYIAGGQLITQAYEACYCYPERGEDGLLEGVRIQYTYKDENDRDQKTGEAKEKWFRLDLTKTADTMYDNPDYDPREAPQFEEVETVEHGMGFVQGQWLSTTGETDGYSLIEDVLGFIDECNYNLCQSAQAVRYNQEPQLIVKGLDRKEEDKLLKSSLKAWDLGRDGDARFLETSLQGPAAADNLRDILIRNISDITRVVILDPEKMVGSAQSAKAMEVLHGPLIELVEELRPIIEEAIVELVSKIAILMVRYNQAGIAIPMRMPPGYAPKSMDMNRTWPSVFSETIMDLTNRVNLASKAAQANLISRITATKYIADIFGVEDIEAEQFIVENQKSLGGGFFF